MKKRIVIGLSGGVDSSVAAYLLKKEGYEVIGLFMKNWHDESVTLSNECPWLEDSNDAMLVAEKLGIPFRIVDYMFNEYAQGRTPNPDVLCNREIKFDVFLDIALSLGADYVATGHYCQKEAFQNKDEETVYRLLAGKDNNKDQSYFLCQLSQAQLSKVLFPIGHLKKAEVREIATTQNLVTADKKDSQGLCFIGKVSLPDFLQQQLKPKAGQIIKIPETLSAYENQNVAKQTLDQKAEKHQYEISDGILIGEHQGAHFYTIGQRKGLGIGGFEEPLFVIDTDVEENLIYVGEGKSHPGLYRDTLKVASDEIHWIRTDLTLEIGDSLKVSARIRYRQPLQKATLFQTKDGLYITFEEHQSAITSGQFVTWYEGTELLGSGVIA
jgi:tRNA-specific 2-thiouridylase